MNPSLRTYLWGAASAFILVASLSFLVHLRWHTPWWTLVLMIGLGVGAVVFALERLVAEPIERQALGPTRGKDGSLHPPAAPENRYTVNEARRLWRGMRAFQEQAAQQRSAQSGLETRMLRAEREVIVLRKAAATLLPEANLTTDAQVLMGEVSNLLGLPAVWLVPLRRQCPIPVVGPTGAPPWGEELRSAGLLPWGELLDEDRPLAICLSDRAPFWRRHFDRQTLWIFPLVCNGRPQGLLLALPDSPERTLTPGEHALMAALTPVLAAALHSPKSSEKAVEKGAEKSAIRVAAQPVEVPMVPIPPGELLPGNLTDSRVELPVEVMPRPSEAAPPKPTKLKLSDLPSRTSAVSDLAAAAMPPKPRVGQPKRPPALEPAATSVEQLEIDAEREAAEVAVAMALEAQPSEPEPKPEPEPAVPPPPSAWIAALAAQADLEDDAPPALAVPLTGDPRAEAADAPMSPAPAIQALPNPTEASLDAIAAAPSLASSRRKRRRRGMA